jgi:hypothetical protein
MESVKGARKTADSLTFYSSHWNPAIVFTRLSSFCPHHVRSGPAAIDQSIGPPIQKECGHQLITEQTLCGRQPIE